MSFRLPINCRNNPSAIGLRQMFPVQTNRTLFTTRCVPRSRTHWQSKFVERQVNAWDWRCDSRRLDFLVLAREKKTKVRGDYKRGWMSDDYCDLIVWYEPWLPALLREAAIGTRFGVVKGSRLRASRSRSRRGRRRME